MADRMGQKRQEQHEGREGQVPGFLRRASMPMLLLVALLVALAAGAVACDSQDGNGNGNAEERAAVSPGQGASQQAQGELQGRLVDSVTATAEGLIETSPDEAVLHVAVETEAQEAREAVDENARAMEEVIDAIENAGVPEDALETMSVSVHPNRRFDPESREEELVGYRAENTVRVTISDVTMVGEVFAAASEGGANRITGPEWRLSDESDAQTRALAQAVEKAQAKADAMAQAAGASAADILILSEGPVQEQPIYREMDAEETEGAPATDDVAPPPAAPGVIEVRAQVTATYSLEPN